MDCGVPFCHGPFGCPLGNLIPVFNDLVYRDRWREAIECLHSTNNFPEFTGRVCPAPCETACTLGVNQPPVAIEQNERMIVERAFTENWIRPLPPQTRTGKKIAVIGSGPSGLAVSQQLNRAGHTVTVFERSSNPGGLLRYGIPSFKLGKGIVQRRVEQLINEGIIFNLNTSAGRDISVAKLQKEFDAMVLCGGSTQARDLGIEGRNLKGIHLAMDYLTQATLRLEGKQVDKEELIDAKDKHVLVIGGGDTGSDCIGTAVRHGARKVTQIEIMPRPNEERIPDHPWPYWPFTLKNSSSHEEAAKQADGQRDWCINSLKFESDSKGHVRALTAERIDWESSDKNSRHEMKKVPNGKIDIKADMVLLALGFLHPEHSGLIDDLKLELDQRGNVKTDEHMQTSTAGVFAAGDMRRGQSLVVWAIAEGREVAHHVDEYLMGETILPDPKVHNLRPR